MRQLDNRNHLRNHVRPKGGDIDKPTGFVKYQLRRKWRRMLKRSVVDIEEFTFTESELCDATELGEGLAENV